MTSKHFDRPAGVPLIVSLIGAILWPVFGLAIEVPKAQPIDGKVKWVYDYREGQRASKETGKPMFVVFRCER